MSVEKIAIFDLDGTLNQTHLYSVKAGYRSVAAMGYDPENFTDFDFVGCLGKRGEDYTRELMPELDDEQVKRYLALEIEFQRELLKEKIADCFPGVRESLKLLKDAGWAIGVCSNSKYTYINMVLEALGIDQMIDHKQELVEGLTKKETLGLLLKRIDAKHGVMVGDRIYDKEAAEHNGLPFVGCAYGYTPEEVNEGNVAASGYELAALIHSL